MRKIITTGALSICAAVFVLTSHKDEPQTTKRLVKINELSQKWPMQVDGTHPLIFVNDVPLFLVQYRHAQRQVTSEYKNQRNVIVRHLVRSELLRQWVTKMMSETTIQYEVVARGSSAHETDREITERIRLTQEFALQHLGKDSMSQSHTIKYDVAPLSSSNISLHVRTHPEKTTVSLDCYYIAYPSENRLDRLNTLDQMKMFERSLKQGRVNFSELGGLLPPHTKFRRFRQVKLKGDGLPVEFSDLLKVQRDMSAGQVLPLIATKKGLWFVYVRSVQTILKAHEQRLVHSKTSKRRSKLASILDEELEEALIEIPAQFLTVPERTHVVSETLSQPHLLELIL